MRPAKEHIRVLYSFPHTLGADRICYAAWKQVDSPATAGADVLVFPRALHRPVSPRVRVYPTLARGKVRIPHRLLGTLRAFALHDWIVARRIEKLVGKIDIIHTWPLGVLQMLKTAARLGIPTVLERPNANTRFAREVVPKGCERPGVGLPPNHEHAYNADKLRKEEEEYRLVDALLCPSDFVVKTLLDKGFEDRKLVRHTYAFDEKVYCPDPERPRCAGADAEVRPLCPSQHPGRKRPCDPRSPWQRVRAAGF
ncbi:MAG: glycosyltransferase [Terriglobia bacterium]